MPDVQAAYDQLAAERGFEPDPGITPGPVTRLLLDAESGRHEELESARLQPALRAPPGEGPKFVVGHLAYTAETTTNLKYFDWKRKSSHRFDLAWTEVPGATACVPRLLCIRRGRRTRPRQIPGSGFVLRHSQRWTESAALNKRYEITIGIYQDLEWMRRLFTPRFVDWLVSAPPPSFSFELVRGTLVGSIDGDDPSAESLGALCDATAHVAARVREECPA
jgi:hypothetical protein